MSSHDTFPSSHRTRRSLLKAGVGGAVGMGLAASGASLLGQLNAPVSAATGAEPAPTSAVGTPLPAAPRYPVSATVIVTPLPGTVTPPIGTVTPPPSPVTPSPAPSVPAAWQAYHNVTGAVHQAKFDDLSASGYRMISISISGDPDDPRYAAVWIQRPGAPFIAMHGVTLDEFRRRHNDALSQGYVATLISAAGPVGNTRFAAVYEQRPSSFNGALFDMPYAPESDPNSFASQFKYWRGFGLGFTPRSFAIYGGFIPGDTRGGGLGLPPERRWAATLQSSVPDRAQWIFTTYYIDADEYQRAFDDLTQRGYRPAALSVTFDRQYAAVFVTAPNVGNWIGRHNLTADQYQQAFNEATAQGLIPLTVQAGGTGDDARYAAVFAQLVP